eukprot:10754380-Lingulodinium_polyedra.AAC.1
MPIRRLSRGGGKIEEALCSGRQLYTLARAWPYGDKKEGHAERRRGRAMGVVSSSFLQGDARQRAWGFVVRTTKDQEARPYIVPLRSRGCTEMSSMDCAPRKALFPGDYLYSRG